MARKSTGNKCKPRVMLHGRILFRDQQGEISDVTYHDMHGLQKFADVGVCAIDALKKIRERLDLLFMAAEHRSKVDASLVRLTVEDIKIELEDRSELEWFVRVTQEMFAHSEALPPLNTDNRSPSLRSPSLTIIKPA